MSNETQKTISDWADQTFGPGGSCLRAARRAAEEMKELLDLLEQDDHHPKAPEEAADVSICLERLFTRLGADRQAEVDRKMRINRSRKWATDGTGCGYHVPEDGAAPEVSPRPAALADLDARRIAELEAEVQRRRRMAIMYDHATDCTIYRSIEEPEHGCSCGWEDHVLARLRSRIADLEEENAHFRAAVVEPSEDPDEAEHLRGCDIPACPCGGVASPYRRGYLVGASAEREACAEIAMPRHSDECYCGGCQARRMVRAAILARGAR